MSFQVTLQPGAHQFAASADETLLQSALAAGLLLPYSCRDGACGVCKGKVVSGRVDLGRYSESSLTASERAQGMALMCCARPLTDLELEVRQVNLVGEIPVKKMPCRVQKLQRLCDDVIVLDLKLPASERFQFRAGQYIDFLLADGKRRSFSIANAPLDGADHLEIHVRLVPGGQFTTHVFERLKEKEILRFEGPLGSFGLQPGAAKPVVLLAGGTGFAPIKSIVEQAIADASTRPMTLYWGSRDRAGLYQFDEARAWEARLPGFRFVPVLSDVPAGEAWDGRRGLAHHALMEDLPDLSGHEVYACGSPAMIDAARSDLVARCDLPPDAFFADAFSFSNDARGA
ncbi:MAG TPA: CDP-6-deoxy-delta-3,4-glucoseen reductase [Rhodocyclaceae bacterium]|uniref:CDP-6-deoxy-delta-3,4-glucoseen reductase n=1 Tax=Zoogloea sp. TaxID=49181 RepID=UPI002C6AECC8|nr:CDP-6-deoxy-delta-3,4-glucoseen reductase [Zoogloea sp.]HMV17524.1 CDP-6-deoxy-delta-3,4-glucoseen reductase [Rhodocyclaceae bacterium]HMV62994.1 CDP-6-deoxy-delta-3,4-glucoseen reductase [Rhodocyclaceae bacterium]HMW52791.1 CDP-6-deoxy-delta-3,4-glucoseen reductase [Rhodocyclaceae bacterium]HMY49750.1 CDP-6-deoxy-delta-3,4-glucoseen reductase [Rhodocyclaceae bacterium]HNA67518.1 CDP-6-deoxy-delta-3,4-glucoseen reductase [Rhodocyclaceae bacterium]